MGNPDNSKGNEIAIIGMAGRFPGAVDVDQFWRNLCQGVESVRSFAADELTASGIDPAVLEDPAYVNAGIVLEEADAFDASFFGYNPREVELMDPQHRLFLECAWTAFENAGYDPEEYAGQIGVYGGVARAQRAARARSSAMAPCDVPWLWRRHAPHEDVPARGFEPR